MNDWTHVILDEVHEREEDMDFLLLLCKKLMRSNATGVKLILMSATISIDKLVDYFTTPMPSGRKKFNARKHFAIIVF